MILITRLPFILFHFPSRLDILLAQREASRIRKILYFAYSLFCLINIHSSRVILFLCDTWIFYLAHREDMFTRFDRL